MYKKENVAMFVIGVVVTVLTLFVIIASKTGFVLFQSDEGFIYVSGKTKLFHINKYCTKLAHTKVRRLPGSYALRNGLTLCEECKNSIDKKESKIWKD
jgi:hypothetical protein